jgi:enoyl-CoA hydratase
MEFVQLVVEENIAVLTIERPKALNALNAQTLREIHEAVNQVAQKGQVRALIVTGAGEKAFVAGADIAEMAHFSAAQAFEFSGIGHRAFAALEALSIPTIAAINGFALGGGLEVALACDLLIASDRAKMGLPEVTLAVVPGFGGTQRLTRLVGKMRAKELLFTGEIIDAAKAKEIGLVLDIVPAAELMAHCKKLAQTLGKRGPLALAQAKRLVEHGSDLPLKDANAFEQQAFGVMFGTLDQKEGMAAFLAKRAPEFTGT